MTDLNSLQYIPCTHRSSRYSTDLIVVHTNEGPEGSGEALNLAHYLQHVDPGYNVVVDQDVAIRTAADTEQMWGAGGVNSRAWHICLIGFSAQTAAQWDDPASHTTIVLAADLVRQAAAKFQIPTVRVTDSRPGNRGICGHVDVSRYYSASMGHTDPGDSFPWDKFIALVNGAPTGVDDLSAEAESQINDIWHFVSEIKSPTSKPGDPPHVGAMAKLNNLFQFLVQYKDKIVAKLT